MKCPKCGSEMNPLCHYAEGMMLECPNCHNVVERGHEEEVKPDEKQEEFHALTAHRYDKRRDVR